MSKLYITRGVPGCGKSTYAKAWVSEVPTARARVNKDDLRGMVHNGTFIPPNTQDKNKSKRHNGTEALINIIRNTAITGLLNAGYNVICDDTNMTSSAVSILSNIANKAGADFEIIDMTNVPLEVCLERNALRTGRARVPDQVIIDMHAKIGKD